MPLTFLFWNIHRQPLTDSIVRLCHLHRVDVLMLAENRLVAGDLLLALNNKQNALYHYLPDNCRKISVFARYSHNVVQTVDATDRATVRAVNIPSQPEFLFVAVHLVDKQNYSTASQYAEARKLAERIRNVEEQRGHTRTLLVGDLNMNPFETGLVAADGFHAVMTRQIAEKQSRVVQSQSYPFFYNPMWNHFGDFHTSPPGTYYYARAEHNVYFWNMFDQVLLRKSLLPMFNNRKLQILQSDGHISFVTGEGTPDKSVASDHLPLLFQLTFREEIE